VAGLQNLPRSGTVSNVNPKKPPAGEVHSDELSLEDTGIAHVRIGSHKVGNAPAAFDHDAAKSPDTSKSTGDLRALSKWIAAHREIAELNGETVRVRTKRKK
jgi:hypothetical protein